MSRLPVLLLLFPAIGCSGEPAAPAVSVPLAPQFTLGSGVTGERLGQATFDIDKVMRITGDWHVELKAKDGLDIAVRRFSYTPNSHTGWHRHPGPVFIQVVQGEVTFYMADDPDCTPIRVGAGHSYLDLGEHAHIGRNESDDTPAQDVTVLFGPPGIAPDAFRIDVPDPGNCQFPN